MQPLNVIVIKSDEYRADLLGCLGHPVIRTPNLDALAASGTLFENAFCCSPLCVPSRTGFFMGQYVHRTRSTFFAPDDYIRRNRWSFVNSFREAGYVIGLAGKNDAFHDDYLEEYFDYREEYPHHGKTHGRITPRDIAVRNWLHDEKRPGFWFYDGRLMEGLIEGAMPFPREDCMTWRNAEDSCRFIDRNSDAPFFLHVSFPDPHWPNVAPEPYYSMYDPDSLTIECGDIDWSSHPFAHYVQSQSCGFDRYTTDERKRMLATYYGQITFIDDAIGEIMGKLEERGLADRTLVVFAADHGCFAGRYGLSGKTKAFYDALLRIPLIMRIPGLKTPRVTADVSNIDVMPTIADHLGLPSSPDVQGVSLLPLLRGVSGSVRDAI
jgi:choline-sulfatase